MHFASICVTAPVFAYFWSNCLTREIALTHWAWATDICVSKLSIIGSDNGLAPTRRPSWNIVNWTLGNKGQWNLNRNSCIFIQENAFKNGVRKKAAILSRPECVKTPFTNINQIRLGRGYLWIKLLIHGLEWWFNSLGPSDAYMRR